MMTKCSRTSAALILVASLWAACSTTSDNGTSVDAASEAPAEAPDFRSFRVVEQLAGWSEVDSSYIEFDATTLFELINGGAQPHVDNGLVEGFAHELESDAERKVEVYVEEFGSEAGAQATFELQVGWVGETLDLASHSASTAVAGRILGGAAVYGHWDQYFFALTLTNYPSGEEGIEAALTADVEAFLDFYADTASP